MATPTTRLDAKAHEVANLLADQMQLDGALSVEARGRLQEAMDDAAAGRPIPPALFKYLRQTIPALSQQAITELVALRAFRDQLQLLTQLTDASIHTHVVARDRLAVAAGVVPQIPVAEPAAPLMALADAPMTTREKIQAAAGRIGSGLWTAGGYLASRALAGLRYAAESTLEAARVTYQNPRGALALAVAGAATAAYALA
jgi:hypothetical protein